MSTDFNLSFYGAVGTVTGSKYLLQAGPRRVLVDCGLFQGVKQLRLRNWAPLPFDPDSVDAVVLTHAHLDHSGYLPLFARKGFGGPVHSTDATRDLCEILLPDSGYLQEKEASFANKYGFSKHRPAQPLYTEAEARQVIDRFHCHDFQAPFHIKDGPQVTFQPAGHILGSALVQIEHGGQTVLFSGDLGRPDDSIMRPPHAVTRADYLVIESTYGNRKHDGVDFEDQLTEIISHTIGGGGTVLIPAFAVGRAQSVLYAIYRLKQADKIAADIPVFLDSPMAINASEIFRRHAAEHRLTAAEAEDVCQSATYVRDPEDSKALNRTAYPKIIISASGMATGGRVLHHLKHYAPEPRNTILFTGFQAEGTRGSTILSGARSVKIHGAYVPIHAKVRNLSMLSAHADANEILDWLRNFDAPPKTTFITHGEPAASDALRLRIEEELGWNCVVPEYRDTYGLG